MVRQQIVHWPDSVGRDEHVNIIKKSEQTFTILELFLYGVECRPLPQRKKCWHEGVSLLPSLCLGDGVWVAVLVMPHVCVEGSE